MVRVKTQKLNDDILEEAQRADVAHVALNPTEFNSESVPCCGGDIDTEESPSFSEIPEIELDQITSHIPEKEREFVPPNDA